MRRLVGWAALCLAGLALIVVPFLLFEQQITAWVSTSVQQEGASWVTGGLIAALLVGDVVLPVPSSLVGTAAGYLFGFAGGTALAWAGMTAGCLAGYWIGATAGRAAATQIVGSRELARVTAAQSAWGDWSVAFLRAVPVLAEASVVYAGIRRMPLGRLVVIAGLANAGVAAAYAAVGAWALAADSFLLAFVGAIALPGVAMGLVRIWRGSRR